MIRINSYLKTVKACFMHHSFVHTTIEYDYWKFVFTFIIIYLFMLYACEYTKHLTTNKAVMVQ